MLDYRVLTFLTLYDEMNYRRTAEKLNMTQPGVTQHIHYLENYYGVKLFEYDGRTLSKTKQAEQLKRHFESVRAEEISLKEDFIQKDSIHLKVGATKTIGEYVIVPEVSNFLQQDNHSLDMIVDNTENLLAMLSHGELDFAVIEGVFDKERYPHHLFKKERFVGICSKRHPFAGKTVSLMDMFREGLIVRERGSGTRRLLEQAITDRGYSLDSFHRCLSVGNFSVICELVARNGAITFAYEPIANSRDDLATFTVDGMEIQGEFNFVYTNEKVASSKIEQFFSND